MRSSRPSLQTLLIVFMIAFLGIATTQALFRDVEQSQKGVFVLGTLELDVMDPNGGAAQSIVVEKLGSGEVLSGSKTWLIKNVGSLPGRFSLSLKNLKNLENGCNEPELLVDKTCNNPGEGEGELGQQITAKFSLLENNKLVELGTLMMNNEATQNLDKIFNQRVQKIVIPAGKSVRLTLDWDTSQANYGNEAQSDSVAFDLVFDLEQVVAGR